MSDTAILKLENVVKVFDYDLFKKNETAVDGLSFSLEEGKCTGLLGHNGAGKTTTIKLILGLIKPTTGKVYFRGGDFKRSALKEIGYMPEVNKLSPNLTPYETLDYQMRLYGYSPETKRRDYIMSTLDYVGLGGQSKKKNKSLSKGQGRRLGFAYATIHKPKLLILDEPFSGLDPVGRDFMQASIENMRGLGVSIFLCSHEVEAVKKLCDDVLILRDGTKVYDSREIGSGDGKGLTGEQVYQLVLSGVGEAEIEILKREFDLPDASSQAKRGFLHTLLFNDFEAASLWLKGATETGILVLEFRELLGSFGDNEDLLQYLRRENTK
jgi:ABC-type multidrug transport system ATPase subunit